MNQYLDELRKCREYLIKHCKWINTGRSVFFLFLSLIIGILLILIGTFFFSNTIAKYICIAIGLLTAGASAIQIIYKKYI